jgi:hypothetical protein
VAVKVKGSLPGAPAWCKRQHTSRAGEVPVWTPVADIHRFMSETATQLEFTPQPSGGLWTSGNGYGFVLGRTLNEVAVEVGKFRGRLFVPLGAPFKIGPGDIEGGPENGWCQTMVAQD